MKPFTKKNCPGGRPRVLRLRFRCRPRGDQRNRLQYLDGGVSGDHVRSVVHGPDGRDDLSADRQLRHDRRGLRDQDADHRRHDRARVQRHALEFPLHEDPARGARGARHSGHFGCRYPGADADHPRRGQPEGDRHRRLDPPARRPCSGCVPTRCPTTWFRA